MPCSHHKVNSLRNILINVHNTDVMHTCNWLLFLLELTSLWWYVIRQGLLRDQQQQGQTECELNVSYFDRCSVTHCTYHAFHTFLYLFTNHWYARTWNIVVQRGHHITRKTRIDFRRFNIVSLAWPAASPRRPRLPRHCVPVAGTHAGTYVPRLILG